MNRPLGRIPVCYSKFCDILCFLIVTYLRDCDKN